MKTALLTLLVASMSTWPAAQGGTSRPAASRPTWTGGPSGKSEMDGTPLVVYRLNSERALKGWPGKSEIPVLVLRCQNGKTEAFVRTGFAPHQDAQTVQYARTLAYLTGRPVVDAVAVVRVRIDDAEPSEEFWSSDTTSEASFSQEPIDLIRRLANARTLRIEFTPFRSTPQVMLFQVAGLGDRVDVLSKACSWPAEGAGAALANPEPARAATAATPMVPSNQRPVRLSMPPTKVKDLPPDYPALARRARVTGSVVLDVFVRPDGTVEQARVTRSIPLLDEAALEAVRKWEYEPTLVSGVAVDVVFSERVEFIP